ncbi:MAG TPA: AMP-binding protein, partial [Aldersonia sp.]
TATTTWALLETLGVTDYAAAPTVYRSLRAAGDRQPPTLAVRRLSSAGEPLTAEINEWASTALGLQVHDHYGQTELGMPIGFPHHPDLRVPVVPGAMGVPLPGWTMTVLADDDTPAETGQPGRLAVRVTDSALMTFTGYADDPGRRSKFVDDGACFTTGDIAHLDDSGMLHFCSRDDDVILMAGYRIGPFDIESVLLRHPAVAECAVIAAPDAVRGEVIEAVVVPTGGADADDALVGELQHWVKTRYSAHAYPRRIHFTDQLPKTPSGKIQRAQLRRQRREDPTQFLHAQP